MGMILQGIELNEQQMAAIVPIINQYSQKHLTANAKLQMERDCLDAMANAGCPLEQP